MEDLKQEIRICPYSGIKFIPKRLNQRFAESRYRVAFHNDINNKIRKARSFVDNKLHKNYSILLELMKDKEQKSFHKEFLKGKGYFLNVMTHYESYDNINRQAIYDFIIIPKNIELNIIRKQ